MRRVILWIFYMNSVSRKAGRRDSMTVSVPVQPEAAGQETGVYKHSQWWIFPVAESRIGGSRLQPAESDLLRQRQESGSGSKQFCRKRMVKNGNRDCVTKIIVECVYVGNRKTEDVFKPINEENTQEHWRKNKIKKEAKIIEKGMNRTSGKPLKTDICNPV